MKVRYKTITVEVPGERSPICECCGKNTKKPQLHHWIYLYKPKEVKTNPKLALENTLNLCFHCHRVANCIRIIMDNYDKFIKLVDLTLDE